MVLLVNGNVPISEEILNIIDVAKLAGVSKTTVSRVITGGESVRPETREKVMNAMTALGYMPNTAARSLAGGKSCVIGIINGIRINDPFYGYIDDLIADMCRKRGYGVVYTVVPQDVTSCNKEISILYGRVDGIVFTGNTSCVFAEDIQKLVDRQVLPVAMVKTDMEIPGALAVDVKNEFGGRQAAEYLLNNGYQKIAYMRGGFHEGEVRERGFSSFLEERGRKIYRHYFGNRNFETAYKSAAEIMNQPAPPDAVFCETDLMAYGLIQGLQALGYSIPKDVAVLGFDNVKFTNYVSSINLTTISQPLETMVEYAVTALIDRIETKKDYETGSVMFETVLKKGDTA